MLPSIGPELSASFPLYERWRLPWTVFLWLSSLPCFAVLVFIWKVSEAIKKEEVFTFQVAKWIRASSYLLFADVCFFFSGNIILQLFGLNHPGIIICSMFIDVLGIALALAAAVLSRYVTKAAVLQEESDATI
jgi:hypothetical protein